MNKDEKRAALISTLNRISDDLEKGYDGFMYLYDVIVEASSRYCVCKSLEVNKEYND